jgi:hypothetical protein
MKEIDLSYSVKLALLIKYFNFSRHTFADT